MLRRENTYFENMEKIGAAFETEKKAMEEKKETIIETYGFDSKEWKAWKEESNSLKYPIPSGAIKAYRAWETSLDREAEELELDDFLWEREVKDFVEALKRAEIESFILTNSSTALMDNLHQLTEEGCKMTGLVKTYRKNLWNEEESLNGIRFEVR